VAAEAGVDEELFSVIGLVELDEEDSLLEHQQEGHTALVVSRSMHTELRS
jgi:hypothetical protein